MRRRKSAKRRWDFCTDTDTHIKLWVHTDKIDVVHLHDLAQSDSADTAPRLTSVCTAWIRLWSPVHSADTALPRDGTKN